MSWVHVQSVICTLVCLRVTSRGETCSTPCCSAAAIWGGKAEVLLRLKSNLQGFKIWKVPAGRRPLGQWNWRRSQRGMLWLDYFFNFGNLPKVSLTLCCCADDPAVANPSWQLMNVTHTRFTGCVTEETLTPPDSLPSTALLVFLFSVLSSYSCRL